MTSQLASATEGQNLVTADNRDSASISPQETNAEHKAALDRLFERIGQMSTLPGLASRVLEVANDESAGASELLEVVERDPSLSLRIMRTVNSSYYGLQNTVADLRSAISLLGFQEVRNLALTVYVSRLFREPGEYRMFDREKLWNHMVAVATTARRISQLCHKAVPEEAYLAGLIHDVGLILTDQFMRRHFVKVLDEIAKGKNTIVAEREILSFDHVDLSAFISCQSHFPDQVTEAIAFHNTPLDYHGSNSELVYIVSVANYLTSREGIMALGVHDIQTPSPAMLSSLGIRAEELSEIWINLSDTLASTDQLVSL